MTPKVTGDSVERDGAKRSLKRVQDTDTGQRRSKEVSRHRNSGQQQEEAGVSRQRKVTGNQHKTKKKPIGMGEEKRKTLEKEGKSAVFKSW